MCSVMLLYACIGGGRRAAAARMNAAVHASRGLAMNSARASIAR